MLRKLTVKNFKSLHSANLELAPVTIFTGPNSSGKSTALLAILLAQSDSLPQDVQEYVRLRENPSVPLDEPQETQSSITLVAEEELTIYAASIRDEPFKKACAKTWTQKCQFLCADRIGPRQNYSKNFDNPFDIYGANSFGYFEVNKNKLVESALRHPEAEAFTLAGQVNYWLQHIVQTKMFTSTEENNSNLVKVSYSHEAQTPLSPLLTGFGTSTLLPTLVLCLSAQKGDALIIENPEIHLHPKAQSRLADFFAFVAATGIQVIVETHCEHLIYKLCYAVDQATLNKEDVVIHYKKSTNDDFESIYVDKRGRFCTKNGQRCNFPSGFFDATVNEYLSIHG